MAEHGAMDLLAEFFSELSEEVAKAGVLYKQLTTILGLSPSSVSEMFKSGKGGNKTPPSWERVERILLFCWEKRDHGKFPGMTETAAARGLADVQSREIDGWKVRHAMLVRDVERARKGATGNSQAKILLPVQAALEVRYSLPPDAAAFTGRAGEVARITAAAADAAAAGGVVTVGAIGGMPGVGKTALAVHAAHLLREQFPDRQLFINLRAHTPGQEPVQAEDALAALLIAVGVDARFLPADLDSRAGIWRSKMAGQRALLVLDNAASSRQITPLLPGSESCLVLVTSRRHLGDLPGTVVPMLLDMLPPQQACDMFTVLAPRAVGFRAEVARVVRLAGFLPLAISLLARVYARHPCWTLANLADEIQAGLLTLTAEHDNIAAAFEVSYRYLDPAQQRLFCLLGLHPGTTTDVYAAAALAAASLEEAARLLDGLQGEGLLTETGHRRYGMHDLLRRYACEHAAAGSAGDSQHALDRLLDYYQHAAAVTEALLARHIRPGAPRAAAAGLPALRALDDARQALAWARAERASLLACLDHATCTGQHARVVALTAALAGLLRRDGPWGDAITRHSAAIQAARDLGDRIGQANALYDLGDVRRLWGDYPEAAQALEQALSVYRDLGDRLGQANALTGLGEVRRMRGDYPEAAEVLEQALSIYRDLGDRLGQASALAELGTVRRMMADYLGSTQALEQALILYHDVGYRIGQARAIHRLADVRRLMGDYPGAAQALEQVLSIYRDLGDRLGQANALTGLGDVRSLTADYPGAARALQQALDISRDLSNRLGQANALFYLGIVRRLTSDYSQASQDLEQALDLYRELGDRGGQTGALNERGTLHRVSGDLALAAEYHQQALELARAIASPWDKAHALLGLGRCALTTGHTMRAETLLQQAYEIFQQIGAADAHAVLTELNTLTITIPQPARQRPEASQRHVGQ